MESNEKQTINIGEILKELRKERQISQEELAYQSNLDRTYISMLERNIKQPTITTIFALAHALNVKPSTLIRIVEEKFPNYKPR